MSQVIAGIYEIQDQIGSGGGGIVYLGRHMRLEKQVVLKADRRTLSTKPEALRREVDMLKGLSHRYIPQVYDFVQEDGVVYTVMDFVPGQSLDKLLSEKRPIAQPDIIRWSCQLLEALSYLHSRPPHGILHGDIKPANIMLRPDGDICLIDYNIALALGENGAVKVGLSRGYASPEHYGVDYSKLKQEDAADATEILVSDPAGRISSSASSGNGSSRGVLLDVRSDIYSLGATLYHLLSGRRPPQEASKIEPLGSETCSEAVAAIIKKAMSPDPNLRYQSAEEMLAAFANLHRQDQRMCRHKRRMIACAISLGGLFLIGGACAFTGLKQLEQRQTALTLAGYSADALAKGDVSGAVELALQAIPKGKNIFQAPVTAQARKALTDALGVYELSDGFKSLATVNLPSAPFQIIKSPEGSRFAAIYAYETAVFNKDGLREAARLPMCESALADAVFIDERHIVYAGSKGVTAYDLESGNSLWTGEKATMLTISVDGTMVAALNEEEERIVVYRISDGKKITERFLDGRSVRTAVNDIFADPGDTIFSLNGDGSLLAVSFADGGLMIYNLKNADEDMTIYDTSDYIHFEGGFCGQYFAFAARGREEALFGMADTGQGVCMEGYRSRNPLSLQTDEDDIYLADGNLLVQFDPYTMEEKELALTSGAFITGFSVGKEHTMIATDDGSFSFYDKAARLMSVENGGEGVDFLLLAGDYALLGNRDEPSLRLMEMENHSDADLLAYDAQYVHDEARISGDGRTAMLFSYQGFRIYDMEGELLAEYSLPDSGRIYDQQFRKDENGSWLEVIWYDGTVRCYRAADGELLSEERREAPAKDLYEEFYTDRYRIESSLHDAPKAYDVETGRLAAVLEEETYLAYVTQLGEYILTEYVSAEGDRYGLLLDDRLETLAYLPKLCDTAGDRLIFDDGSGNLRQCRLYSLQELIALGEATR